MFLDNFDKNLPLRKTDMEFNLSYKYWVNNLLEYCMKIFTLENLPKEIPQHEPDAIAYLKGYVPIVKLSSGEWCASVESGLYGITDYYDEFTHINFTTPLHFGKRRIGKNAFIIRNTELKNPLYPTIKRYAALLAHSEVSIICELVNLREDGLFEAIGENQKDTIDLYMNRKYQGKPSTIVNKAFSMIKHEFKNRSQHENVSLWDLRNEIFKSFLEEIGVKKQNEKRERLVNSEVSANNILLKLNIANMHKTRQKDWDKFNEITGNNVKVICNIDYDEKEGVESENKEVKNNVRSKIISNDNTISK